MFQRLYRFNSHRRLLFSVTDAHTHTHTHTLGSLTGLRALLCTADVVAFPSPFPCLSLLSLRCVLHRRRGRFFVFSFGSLV
jgi:hypothetical protein